MYDDKVVLSARKESLALLALSGVNGKKIGGLKDKLKNESLFGHDNYLKDQANLLHSMNKYKPEVARIQILNQKKEGVAFIQADKETKQSDKANNNKDSSGGTWRTKVNKHKGKVADC